jgi:hypothetical protein
MKNIPGGHNLFVQDKEVATLIENVYSVRSILHITLLATVVINVCVDSVEVQVDVAEEGGRVDAFVVVAVG